MSSSLSPVLAAYFGGQKQQADIITQAKEISEEQARRQQSQQELQQRQQTIDEIAKQHGIENQKAQSQLELAQSIAADTHKYHMNEAADNLISQMRNANIAPSQTTPGGPGGNLVIPESLGLNIPGLPGSPQPISNGVQPTQAPVTINPIQNITLPSGDKVQVPAWNTAAQADAAKRQADLGSMVDLYNQTTGKTDAARMADQLKAAEDRVNMMQQFHEATGMYQNELLDYKRQLDDMKFAGGRTPEQVSSDAAVDGQQIANGQKSVKDLQDPISKKAAQAWLTANGMVEPPKGAMTEFNTSAESLERLANSLPGMRSLLQTNTQPGGTAANMVRNIAQKMANTVGGTASPIAATFQTLQKSIAPDLEKAQGLSLARAGSSPQMAIRMDQMQPNLTDTPDIANTKIATTADVYLAHMADQISTLPVAQRKTAYAQIINDHPGILQNLPGKVAAKLAQAKVTGIYNAGGVQ